MLRSCVIFLFFLSFGLSVSAQERALKVSFGVGKYFPDDERYSHFFEHKPVNYSVELGYAFWVLNIETGLEHFAVSRNTTEQFYYRKAYPPDRVPYDSFLITGGIIDVKSNLRSSAFRVGVVLSPWENKMFSPFIGVGGSLISSKGYGDSSLVRSDTFYNNTAGGRPGGYYFIFDSSKVPKFKKSALGGYIKGGLEVHLPYSIFFIFEAIHDLRFRSDTGILGSLKGGTLIGLRMGYRIRL